MPHIHKSFPLYLIILFMFPHNTKAVECNSCNVANSLACYSSTQMQSCTNGVPSFVPFSCPTGSVCTSTLSGILCQPNAAGVVASCTDCNKCDATGAFACTGTNQFALCLNSNKISNIIGTCGTGLFCNIENPFICGSTTDGILPSCSFADDETSTSPPTASPTVAPTPSQPNTFCAALQQNGRFSYGTNPNSTCRQYVYCFMLNGVWRGNLYTCPGNTFFSNNLQRCTTEVPAYCTGVVASLRIFDVILV